MADWLRFLRDDDDDNVVVNPAVENEIELDEERRYVSPVVREDLARIVSLFLILLLVKALFFVISLFRPSWLTAIVDQLGLDSLIVLCCSLWIVAGGRFLVGLAVIAIVVLSRLLIIGGLIERNTIEIGRAMAADTVSFGVGVLFGLFFRK